MIFINPQEIEDIFGKAVRDIVDEVKNQSRTSAISNLVFLTQKCSYCFKSSVAFVVFPIEVASVINRKGLARAGSWFMTEG